MRLGGVIADSSHRTARDESWRSLSTSFKTFLHDANCK